MDVQRQTILVGPSPDGAPPSPPPNRWRDSIVVPAVGPRGQITVTFFERRLIAKGEAYSMGETPVIWDHVGQSLSVPRWARDEGWVLYEDLCKGEARAAPGAITDSSAVHWRVWSGLAKLRAQGKAPARDSIAGLLRRAEIKSLYHPEVERRREVAAKGGLFALDTDALFEFLGFEQQVDAAEILDEDSRKQKPRQG